MHFVFDFEVIALVSDEPHAFPDPSPTIHNMVSQ